MQPAIYGDGRRNRGGWVILTPLKWNGKIYVRGVVVVRPVTPFMYMPLITPTREAARGLCTQFNNEICYEKGRTTPKRVKDRYIIMQASLMWFPALGKCK